MRVKFRLSWEISCLMERSAEKHGAINTTILIYAGYDVGHCVEVITIREEAGIRKVLRRYLAS